MNKVKTEEIQYTIQSIIFPIEEKHKACRKLFYKGDRGIIDVNNESLSLGYAQRCDFTTYLNACSYQKWKKYTAAKKLTVEIEFCGDIEVSFIGYHKQGLNVCRVDFDTNKYSSKKRTTVSYTYPENDEQMVGFEISALSNCTIFGGHYSVNVNKSDINDIILSIATTTCHKEDFIIKNVNLLNKKIFETDDEVAKNCFLHVVDNGQTLTTKEISGKHVTLYPNINTGGSGGYARGMIETLHQKTKATHVLLMDDDVLILPESIRRTFHLLKLLRPEFKNNFISGAMLYYEDPEKQHEDIGSIDASNGGFSSLKGTLDHSDLSDSLENEDNYPSTNTSYAAWWYCCIPIETIKKNGLPLPIFIRCDDAEYGLRCSPEHFITMNGICIWHMGFTTKYNPAVDLYQQARNLLVAKATFDILKNTDLITTKIYTFFRTETLRFNYGAAELVIKALEDYMKGPKFLMEENSDRILKENSKLNPIFIPLDQLEDGSLYRISDSIIDVPLSFSNRVFLKITRNGNHLFPSRLMNNNLVPVGFSWGLYPQRIAKHSRLLAINPYDKTGCIYELDKNRYKELNKRYKKAMHNYKKNGKKVEQEYKDAAKTLTSEEFWKKYLKI